MSRKISSRIVKLGCLAAVVAGLSACNTVERLAEVGATPDLRPIENPVREAGYEPVTLPMPKPDRVSYEPNSLWRLGAKAFFKDQRASRIGDILTVNIEISDSGSLTNTTERTRTHDDDNDLINLLGFEDHLDLFLPEAVNPNSLVDINSSQVTKGDGSVDRTETISLTVAALITQILPNGNMIIRGRQEMQVNFEVRELWITGVVRPEDISSGNIVSWDKIAEARAAYGGRGTLSDLQQPRYGTQILDILYPF